MPDAYDAIVIGTGQGGKPLAGALAEAGRRTAIIERGRVGGTCVIDGCTPTKTMIASARIAHLAGRAGDFGVETGPVRVDLEVVRGRKRDIVDSWSEGSRKGLERHESLDLLFGEARFTGPRAVAIRGEDGGERHLEAPHVFINAGTRTAIPPVPGLEDVDYLTSTTIMELGEVPEHLVVLGGGFIGLEFAQMFRRFGSDVTIVEQAPRLIRREDEDVAKAVAEILEEDGVDVMAGTAVEHAEQVDGRVFLRVTGDGGTRTVEGTHLLVAVGRVPNSDALELDAAGIEVTDRGFVRVDARLETSVSGVYALGDVNGGPPFTHVSYDDYRIVKRIVLDGEDASTEGRLVPYTLFTDPPLGRVGMTEHEARDEGRAVRVAKLPMTRAARAIETDETRGFMKAVVDGDTDRILGAAMLGIEGGEVATVVQMAMLADLPYTVLRDGLFSHPTLSESLNNLFMAMEG